MNNKGYWVLVKIPKEPVNSKAKIIFRFLFKTNFKDLKIFLFNPSSIKIGKSLYFFNLQKRLILGNTSASQWK